MPDLTLKDMLVEKGKAGYAALYLNSLEDQRAMREIRLAADALGRQVFHWSATKGLILDAARATPIQNTDGAGLVGDALLKPATVPDNCIVVLRQFHHYLKEPLIQAQLLDIIPQFKMRQKMLIVLSPVITIPPELEKEFTLVEAPLPDEDALNAVIDGIIDASKIKAEKRPSPERRKLIIEAAKGLTTLEAENAISLSVIRPNMQGKKKVEELWIPQIVLDEKCMALRKTGILEYAKVPEGGLDMIGGLDELKDWVRPLGRAFGPEARQFGLSAPKGVLLVGPPGCGKSLSAKAISSAIQKPLLKLEVGKIYNALVGASEANLRMAIRLAEAMAPCILWMDEIEKGLANSSGGGGDSGVSQRILGHFLTWMSEKTSDVFVVATANNIKLLPPEVLRKGRFDEIFSVDLPDQRERTEILRIHIARRNRAHLIGKGQDKVDLEYLSAETTQDFTGAEIDGCIEEAMRRAFYEGKEINTDSLELAFNTTNPISKTMSAQLQELRDWCAARTRSANRKAQVAPQVGTMGRQIQGIGQA